jgi:hypothetical protein
MPVIMCSFPCPSVGAARLAIVVVALLWQFAPVATAGQGATLSARQCERGVVEDPEFAVYGEDALRCTFRCGERVVMKVLSVDIETYCARVGHTCGPSFASPKLLDAQGREVGRLPDNFPGEAAVSYVIKLERFVDGWPEQLRLVGTSQGVAPAPQWTPLRWQRAKGQYSESMVDEGVKR